jgi:MFS family permease
MTQTATYFCVFVVAQALGSGANPALSSLALMFADPNETGKLMGALAVSQVLSAQVLAPVLFGSVYAYVPSYVFIAFFTR